MHMKTLAVAAALAVSLTSSAFAQTAAGGGSAEGNMNSPGSVKSNSEKGMERAPGSAAGSVNTTGSTMKPGMSNDMPSNATPGAPGGSNGGNAATGSGAAPSGK